MATQLRPLNRAHATMRITGTGLCMSAGHIAWRAAQQHMPCACELSLKAGLGAVGTEHGDRTCTRVACHPRIHIPVGYGDVAVAANGWRLGPTPHAKWKRMIDMFHDLHGFLSVEVKMRRCRQCSEGATFKKKC